MLLHHPFFIIIYNCTCIIDMLSNSPNIIIICFDFLYYFNIRIITISIFDILLPWIAIFKKLYLVYFVLVSSLSKFKMIMRIRICLAVNAVKYKFRIRTIVFLGQLYIQSILSSCTPWQYLKLRLHFWKFPIYNTDFLLVTHDKIISFIFSLSCFSHPLFTSQRIISIFYYFLSHYQSNGIKHLFEAIWILIALYYIPKEVTLVSY